MICGLLTRSQSTDCSRAAALAAILLSLRSFYLFAIYGLLPCLSALTAILRTFALPVLPSALPPCSCPFAVKCAAAVQTSVCTSSAHFPALSLTWLSLRLRGSPRRLYTGIRQGKRLCLLYPQLFPYGRAGSLLLSFPHYPGRSASCPWL